MSGLSTVASLVRGGQVPKPVRGYIIPLDIHNNDATLPGETRTFQYFPDTIQDNKASVISNKTIPGLSHPIYQWVAGGERAVSFMACFTRDKALTQEAKGANEGRQSFINTSDDSRNVDIPSAVAWLKSFSLPEGTADGSVGLSVRPKPPRKMILGLPGVRINQGIPGLCADQMYAIMTECSTVYEGFFADGTPRITKLNLTFVETIQIGGRVINHDARDKRLGGLGYVLNNDNRGKK